MLTSEHLSKDPRKNMLITFNFFKKKFIYLSFGPGFLYNKSYDITPLFTYCFVSLERKGGGEKERKLNEQSNCNILINKTHLSIRKVHNSQ